MNSVKRVARIHFALCIRVLGIRRIEDKVLLTDNNYSLLACIKHFCFAAIFQLCVLLKLALQEILLFATT